MRTSQLTMMTRRRTTVKTIKAKLREVNVARAKARGLKSASAGAVGGDGDVSNTSSKKLSQASSSNRLDKVKAASEKARKLKALGAAEPAKVNPMSEEVCAVLVLPKDHPRNVRRGIMIRNTKLDLRKMA